jgi:thioredoxin 1
MKLINYFFVSLLILILVFCGCEKDDARTKSDSLDQKSEKVESDAPKITFVELGSVNCIPCKMMQPVMKAIEEEFGNQVDVVFHDVWKDAEPGRKYRIKLIPTQVFLDESGNEFFRHEGYFPKKEIEKLLAGKGLKKLNHVDIGK